MFWKNHGKDFSVWLGDTRVRPALLKISILLPGSFGDSQIYRPLDGKRMLTKQLQPLVFKYFTRLSVLYVVTNEIRYIGTYLFYNSQ